MTSWTRDFWRVAAWGVGDSAAYLLFVAAADRGPAAVASVLAAQFATVPFAGLISGERPCRAEDADVLVIVAVTGNRRARRIARSGLRVTVRGVRDAGLDGDTEADRRVRPRTVLGVLGLACSSRPWVFVYSSWRIITWILIALFLAMALNPAVEFFERRGCGASSPR